MAACWEEAMFAPLMLCVPVASNAVVFWQPVLVMIN